MKGDSENRQVISSFISDNAPIILADLRAQLKNDILNGLVTSTLSATKITRDHIHKLINKEEVDTQVINKLCKYYYGLGVDITVSGAGVGCQSKVIEYG